MPRRKKRQGKKQVLRDSCDVDRNIPLTETEVKGCGKACTTPTSRLCKPRLRSLGLSTNLAYCIFVVGYVRRIFKWRLNRAVKIKVSHFKDCYCIKVMSAICMMDSYGSTPVCNI